jgi:hypothetical protein
MASNPADVEPREHLEVVSGSVDDPALLTKVTQEAEAIVLAIRVLQDDGAELATMIDPPRAISWRTGTEDREGPLSFGGWFWRYDLAPLGPSETEVTLTYDWPAVSQDIREYLQFPPFGPEHLANSLHHLAGLAAPASQPSTPGA